MLRFGRTLALGSVACALFALASPALGETKVRRVGILSVTSVSRPWFEPFHRTLRELGWVEGKNLAIEYRHAEGDPDRYPALAKELVELKVDVLFPVGPPAVRAARAATKTIPIVAHDLETDPIAVGYVESYARPGGTLTGLFLDIPELSGKRLELLKAVSPSTSRATVLWDSSGGPAHLNALKSLAPRFGLRLEIEEIRKPDDLNSFVARAPPPSQALIVLPSPLMYMQSKTVAQFVTKHRVPAISMFRPFAEAGGLISYGPQMPPTAARCAVLVAKVLEGADPGKLPIERPTLFEFVVNAGAAKLLGIAIPEAILLRADEVVK